jgi:catechol 2,3-dioxygenase
VHLHVADLPDSKQFYHGLLGFDITMDIEAFGGIFFSAGGYHHHIGTNVWQGVGAPPPPPDAVGLRYFTVVLPDNTELERVVERAREAGISTGQTEQGILVRDPAQNGLLLTDQAAS